MEGHARVEKIGKRLGYWAMARGTVVGVGWRKCGVVVKLLELHGCVYVGGVVG